MRKRNWFLEVIGCSITWDPATFMTPDAWYYKIAFLTICLVHERSLLSLIIIKTRSYEDKIRWSLHRVDFCWIHLFYRNGVPVYKTWATEIIDSIRKVNKATVSDSSEDNGGESKNE